MKNTPDPFPSSGIIQGAEICYLLSTTGEEQTEEIRDITKKVSSQTLSSLPGEKRLGDSGFRDSSSEYFFRRQITDVVSVKLVASKHPSPRKFSCLAVDTEGRLILFLAEEYKAEDSRREFRLEVLAWRHLDPEFAKKPWYNQPGIQGVENKEFEYALKYLRDVDLGREDPTRSGSFVSLISTGCKFYFRRLEVRHEDCSLEIVLEKETEAQVFLGFGDEKKGYIWACKCAKKKKFLQVYDADFSLLSEKELEQDGTKEVVYGHLCKLGYSAICELLPGK